MFVRNRSGQSAISALVGAGIALTTIAAVATMVTYAMKAGKSAQGLSEAGLLTDSIRVILSNNDRCVNAFQVAPAGGGAPVAPVLASDGASVSLSTIGTSSGGTFSPYASVGQKFGSISITGMTLTRVSPSLMKLQIAARKADQAIGGMDLNIPDLLIATTINASTGAITSCSLGSGASAPGSIVKCRKNSSGTTAGIYSGHVKVTFGPSDCEGKTLDSSYVGTAATVNVCNGAIDWTVIDPTATSSPAIDFGSRGGSVCTWPDGNQYDISVVYISKSAVLAGGSTPASSCQRFQYPTKDMGAAGILRIQGHASYAATAIQWCKEKGFNGTTTRISEYMDYGNRALWNVGTPGVWETNLAGVTIAELECCP